MMSAPLAIGQTSKPNMNLQNKKSFQIASNNTNYSLSLSYNDKFILFEIEKEAEFPKQEYSLLVDLNQLNLININISLNLKIFLKFNHLLKL